MKFWVAAYTVLLVLVLLLTHEWLRFPDGKLHITLLDVGQGDSILITTPGRQRVLIDGGPDLTLLEKLGEELPFLSRRVDLLILTHPDADHITAFPEVLRRFDVSTVLMTGVQKESSIYSAFLDAVRESDARVIFADASHDLDFGAGAMFDILWPLESILGEEPSKQNNFSIVGKLYWKEHEVLLTGDIEEKTERELLASGSDLHSDIVKVPHHGSKTSSSTGFLLAIQPDTALMSLGEDNTYGHPHPSVLARYEAMGIPIRRTDQEGRVEVVLE